MYSAVWVNQFEFKKTCIAYVINNVSLQRNYVKIEYKSGRNFINIYFDTQFNYI